MRALKAFLLTCGAVSLSIALVIAGSLLGVLLVPVLGIFSIFVFIYVLIAEDLDKQDSDDPGP